MTDQNQNPYQPQDQQPSYGAPQQPYQGQNQQYQPYNGAPAGPKTNVLAIVSLIASLSGFILLITPIVGIITGHIALNQIKRTGENGRGLALAGTIVGYVLTALVVLGTILFIAFFSWIISEGVSYDGSYYGS
jgi:hypothetical protein